MSALTEKVAKIFRAYNEARLLVLQKRKPAPRFFHLLANRPNWKRVILHAIVAYALFAGCCFWIAMHLSEIHESLKHLLLLGAWGISVGYLFVVWLLTHNRK